MSCAASVKAKSSPVSSVGKNPFDMPKGHHCGGNMMRAVAPSDRNVTTSMTGYARGLRWALHYKPVMLVVSFLSLGAAALIMFPPQWWPLGISKGFFPTEDTGLLFAFTEAAQDISFESMAVHQT